MRNLSFFGAAILLACLLIGDANAQGVYYARRPIYPYAVPYNSYPVPSYSYYGGWYPGSYGNIYGNYGSYHVMTPYWNGGYRYRSW